MKNVAMLVVLGVIGCLGIGRVQAADPEYEWREALRTVVTTQGLDTAKVTNALAGATMPVCNGANVTNVTAVAMSAAGLVAGSSATAINGAAITNLTAANIVPAGTTRTLTNMVWDAGATTGTITIVNGRVTSIQ